MAKRLRLGAQDGSTAAEYIGFGTVIAAVIVALFAFDPSLADRLRSPVDDQVCKVLRADCEGADLPTDDRVADRGGNNGARPGARAGAPVVSPTVVCDVSTRKREVGAGVTVVVVSAEGGLAYEMKERSDGSYEVTFIGSGSLGLELIKGASAESGDSTVGASGSLGISPEGEVQRTYKLKSKADAEALIGMAKRAATDTGVGVVRTALGVINRNPIDLVRGVGGTVRGLQGWDPPVDASRTRIQGSVSVEAAGSSGTGVASIGGLLEVGNVLGADIDHEEDTTTVYARVEGDAAVDAGVLPAAIAGVGADGDLTMAMKVRNSDGAPLELSLATTVKLAGNVDVPAITGAMAFGSDETAAGLRRAVGEASGLLRHEDTVSVKTEAKLDLTRSTDEELAAQILARLATPGTSAGDGALGRYLADNATISGELWTGDKDAFDLKVRAGAGAGGSFNVKNDTTTATFVGAVDRAPGGDFTVRRCGAGPG